MVMVSQTCEDDDCSTELFCYESDCTDGDDEDNDELVDCDDDDCSAHETCFEYECDDTLDDDGDELIDCDDPIVYKLMPVLN